MEDWHLQVLLAIRGTVSVDVLDFEFSLRRLFVALNFLGHDSPLQILVQEGDLGLCFPKGKRFQS